MPRRPRPCARRASLVPCGRARPATPAERAATWDGWSALSLAVLLLAGGAHGQGLPANPPLPPIPGAAAAPPAADPGADPPYEPQLERLAERLGTLALMRALCGDGDAAEFRTRMAALLEAEAGTPQRRDRLAGAFNRGFDGYAASYRSCTPSARSVIARSLAEADRLTRDLAARYGGT